MILPRKSYFSNVILIGMAGAGKSTVGPALAEQLGYSFVDTDDMIAAKYKAPLQEVLDMLGQKSFRTLEEKVLLSINVCNHVIATGGSAVYSHLGMRHLQETGLVVWLDVALSELVARVNNLGSRGLINPDRISFAELYLQRLELYRRYAAVRLDCTGKTVREIVLEIEQQLLERSRKS